jgi:thiamine phosphate phosphatase / amino-HMP aminohydrolase
MGSGKIIGPLRKTRLSTSGASAPQGVELERLIEAERMKARLLTASDKARMMQDIVMSNPATAVGDAARKRQTVYIGDSTTDLACLLQADIGLVMADGEEESKLIQALQRLGWTVPHVSEVDGSEVSKGQMVWARSFREILDSKVLGWL